MARSTQELTGKGVDDVFTRRGRSLSVIVFSKDRPLQLEGCLESFQENFRDTFLPEINVVYTTSSKQMYAAYQDLQKRFPLVTWELEFPGACRLLTNEIVQRTKATYTMFLTDDCVFVRPWSLADDPLGAIGEFPQAVHSCLLLMHPGITERGRVTPPVPENIMSCSGAFVWNWSLGDGPYGYPMGIDGVIYRTEFLQPLIAGIGFNSPSMLSVTLNSLRHVRECDVRLWSSCFMGGPVAINLRVNTVQTDFSRGHVTKPAHTVDRLLQEFLEGHRLNWRAYRDYTGDSLILTDVDLELLELPSVET
jgi:hypothetical protein